MLDTDVILTLADAQARYEALGHKGRLVNISGLRGDAVHYVVCPVCERAAEFSPDLAKRHGWDWFYGPATRGKCGHV